MPSAQVEKVTRSNAILTLLTGDPKARAQAAWIALCELMHDLDTTGRRTLAMPAPLRGVTLEQLTEARAQDPQPPLYQLFAAWRRQVYALESEYEARLSVLAGSWLRIAWLRSEGFDAASLDRFEVALAAHLRRVWGLEPPPATRWREWASHHARRRDLVPRAWREL